MRLCRVYLPRRLLLIHPFRCVMLFLLVWSRDVVVVVVIVLVLVSVVVIVVVAAVDVLLLLLLLLLLLFGCKSRSGSGRPCVSGCMLLLESVLLSFVVAVCVVVQSRPSL